MTDHLLNSFFTLHEAEEIDSTQEWVKKLYRDGVPEGTVASAATQTAGRGRGNRRWSSPKGTSLSFSILVKPAIPPRDAPMLSIVMGLAVHQGIDQTCGTHTLIKWPNDVILSSKKVCGILTELIPTSDDTESPCVIGAGVNNGIESFPPELYEKATSILMETGQAADRRILLDNILNSFLSLYRVFLKNRSLADLMDAYNAVLVNRGRLIRLVDHKTSYTATADGIDETGALKIIKEDGTAERISSGEVSVRGIYGYV